MSTPSSKLRVWFVTGSSSGMGRMLTELVLSRGEIVVATLRKPSVLDALVSKYPSSQLLVLKCDVSIPSDITAAFAEMETKFGRCDIVFNNAGYPVVGEIEGTPDEMARRLFDVNLWGAANVSKEAVKFFREVNPNGTGGRILISSSVAGIVAGPALGHYCASKFALEGVTEALAQELDPAWNIKITLINFGQFETNGTTSSLVYGPPHPAYASESLLGNMTRKWIESPNRQFGDPAKAVKVVYRLADEPQPPSRIPVGKSAIQTYRKKIEILSAHADKYESWSEDLGDSS